YPVRKFHLSKFAERYCPYSFNTSVVSRSGSTEKETSYTSSNSASSKPSCKIFILRVIGGQIVVQFVNTKFATHHCPSKSFKDTSFSSWFIASKDSTLSEIVVDSIGCFDDSPSTLFPVSLLQAEMLKIVNNKKSANTFFMFLSFLYIFLLKLAYHKL